MKLTLKLLIPILFAVNLSFGQTVMVMDFVKIKEGKSKEALFFYENNWKLYREEALKKKYITAYQIVKTPADSLANFDLILITEYASRADHQNSEKNFEPILKQLRPNGPKMLNNLKPDDFRQNVFVKIAELWISSEKRE